MFLFTFLMSFMLIGRQINARIYPLNTATVAGKQLNLVCENHPGKISTAWHFLRFGERSNSVIYNGTHLFDQFTDFQIHNTADGLSTLTKRFSGKVDAGTYKCIQKNEGDFDVSSSQVTVLADDPVCSPREANVFEEQYLELNCSVHYLGSFAPIVKWSMDDGIDSNLGDNVINIRNSTYISSTLKMNATRGEHNVTFVCTTYFNQSMVSHDNQTDIRKAINAPTYEYQCTHRLNVLFVPDAIAITPKKDVYILGDVLLCTANGNPTPTYEWTEHGSNRVVSGESYLTLDRSTMENNAYKCTATNYATGKGKSISDTVAIRAIILPKDDGDSAVWSLSVVAGVICAILTLIIFVILIKRFNVLECLSSCMQGEGDYGPDIVQNADENGNERYALEENGYARPDDLGLGTPPVVQHTGFAPGVRDEGAFINHNGAEAYPVYAEAHKKSHAVAGNASGSEIPVYGKVQKKSEPCLEYASSESKGDEGDDTGPKYPFSSQKQFIGADGTEYMEMSEVRSLSSTTLPPLFERSQYAEIDHTQNFSK